MINIPISIYLQIEESIWETSDDFSRLVGVSWADDDIHSTDIKYTLDRSFYGPITEIRSDYVDTDTNLRYIDVWFKEDEGEAGISVATVNEITKEIIFKNTAFCNDPTVKEEINNLINAGKPDARWVEYVFGNVDQMPKKYGKYYVHRKDGKMHDETWNGTGWAYNGNVITHFMCVAPPNSI